MARSDESQAQEARHDAHNENPEAGQESLLHSKMPSRHNFMIILVSAISSFCFGYGNNAGGGCYAQETFLEKFLSGSNANALIDAMNAIFLAGGFIGTMLQSFVSDKFGRRFCTEMAAVLMVLSGILSAASVNPAMFIVSRGIGGISGGIILANTPVYMSEIAPAHIRGLLVGMHATTILSGYVLSGVLAVAFNFVTSDIQWRLQFIMLTFFSLVFAISVPFLPESPRWLVEQGRVDEARKILEKLHRTKADPSAELARAESLQIEAQVQVEKDLPHSYWYILSNAHLRKRAYCSILTFAMVQSSGLVVIFNLMPILFAALGFNNVQELGLSVVWVTIGAIGAGTNAFLADRVGRVKLMVTGGYLLVVNMAIQCALQKTYLHSTYKPGINASVAFFFIFILFYSTTCDCVVYVYNAEIWPTHLRSKGVTFGVGSYFLFGIAYSGPAAQAFNSIGWKYYLVFICVTFVTATLILLTFPETKGLSLEEVNLKFGDSVEMTLRDIQMDDILKSKPMVEATEVEEVKSS